MTDPKDDGVENLTGAYALDALSPQERAAVEAAMAESESLRTEIVELTDTAVELGLAVPPVTPRPELRASVLAALDDVPQDAPARRRVRGAAETKAKLRWGRVGVMLASAAAIAVLVVGGITVTHFTNPMTVLTSAQDLERVTEPVEGGGTATVMWSASLGQAAMVVEGIGPLPDHFVYQAWFMGDEIRSAGVFTGDAAMVLEGEMHAGDQIGISIEPEGGSAQPTTSPILAVDT